MYSMDKCNQIHSQTTNSNGKMQIVKTQWYSVLIRKKGLSIIEIPSTDYKKIENYRSYGFKVASSISEQNVMYLFPPHLTRSKVLELIRQIEGLERTKNCKQKFESQGLFSYITSLFGSVRRLPETVNKIEETVNIAHGIAKPLNENIVKPLFSASDLFSQVFNKIIELCKWFIYDVVLGDGLTAIAYRMFIFKFIPYLYRFLKESISTKPIIEAQSLDTLIMASLFSGVVGSRLMHIFKNITLFTRLKILDDLSFVQDCMAYILEIPFLIAIWLKHKSSEDSKLSKNCQWFSEVYSQYILEKIPFTRMNRLVRRFESLFSKYNLNNSILSDTDFQEEYESFMDDYKTWKDVYLTMSKTLPVKILHSDKKINDFYIRYLTYKNATRTEPLCFLFYGPPGCGKSTLLSRLVKEIGLYRSVYTHASIKDRDFYDHYNNEDVFVMDDIGQKGVYQWSDIINMVSTIRYPLNCAEAPKKGTKHFSSSFLLFTSNINPANITLTADCGITDKEALCRRIKLIDFTHVEFVNGIWTGNWTLKLRDTKAKTWTVHSDNEIKSNEQFLDSLMATFNHFSVKQDVTNSYTPKGKVGRLYIPNRQNDPFSLDRRGDIVWEGNMMPTLRVEGVPEQVFLQGGDELNIGVQAVIQDEIQDASKDILTFELLDKFCMEPVAEATWQSEFVRLLSNIAEFVNKCFSFNFSSFSNFMAHLKDLICRPISACISSFLIFSSSFIFLCYFVISKYFCKGKQFVNDVIYVNKPVKKISRTDWIPDAFSSVEEVVYDKVSTLERVGDCKGVYFFELTGVHSEDGTTRSVTGIAICTAKVAVVPHHYISQFDLSRKVFITVKTGDGSVLVDNARVNQVFSDLLNDVVVLNLQISYQFPRLRFGNLDGVMQLDNVFIGTPYGISKTGGSFTNLGYKSNYYVQNLKYPLFADDIVSDMSIKGLCGSIYYCMIEGGYIPIGMHVAGSTDGKMGICKKFSKSLLRFLIERPNNATAIVGGVPGMSLAKTDVDLYQNIPDRTTYVESAISGIYPKERVPANLKVSVKEISKKSLTITKKVDIEALDYAESFINVLIPEFTKSSELEVVNGIKSQGITIANPINKETSCGFGYDLKKDDYLDYERGVFKPFLRKNINKLRSQLAQGSVQVSDAIHAEILKDELRNVEKVDKPRSFKMAPLHVTCLQREYLLDLLVNLHQNRNVNGVRVCINPFSDEWTELMRKHQAYGHSFDGDWGKWDGGMLPQFQSVLRSVLVKKFNGNHDDKIILDNLLLLIQNCPTITLNDVYYTTHSLPSGISLTAEYNSLINKMLTAYIFYILHKQQFGFAPTLQKFLASVRDDVYGDDKLVSVNAETATWFNGKSFERIANGLGLDFTPASKGEWTYTTQSIEKCTFLKRGFRYNDYLQAIVAPLEMKTITSTLNYVKDPARNYELSIVKLLNFQRELFLHGSTVYNREMEAVKSFLASINFEIQFLGIDELTKLYKQGNLFDPIVMA